MLGIDIVDLHDPVLKERDERSLRFIKHPADTVIEHDQIYWLLWSAKEAVFKCLREANNYSPTSIPVIMEETDGKIIFTSNHLEGEINITSDYILAICSDNLKKIQFEIIKATSTVDSDSLRKEINDYFKELNVQIGSDDLNLPILLPSEDPISISHHRNYGAFAFPSEITP